jgi:type I restriction enzyme, S subunit
MSAWPIVALEDVFDVARGGSPRPIDSFITDDPDGVNWIMIGDATEGSKYIATTKKRIIKEGVKKSRMVSAGDFLLTNSMSFGKPYILKTSGCIHDGWLVLSPRHDQIHSDFFYHLLGSDVVYSKFKKLAAGAVVKNLNSELVRGVPIPLPPLAEQKRIAAILDKADAIRRKLQQSLRLSDNFLRSVFLDMFGDPVTNPKGWPVEPLSEGVESFDGGKNVNPVDADRRDGMRVLKVSAVTSGEYLEVESKSFGEDFQVPADYIVKTGDLLISRANTAELVGAVAYVWNTTGRAMLPDKLWRFVWSKPAKIHPLFMLHMARSEHFRKQLILRATGSSGSMKNIGKVKMLEIPIPLPPIALQNKFAAIVTKTQGKIQKSTAFLKEAESLFSTLQQRAFRGEL